jgi:hypothetical protein
LAQLAAGRINPEQASAIAEGSWSVPPEATARYEHEVLTHADEQTAGQTRQRVERARIAADPTDATRRHRQAVEHRAVGIAAAGDGMASLCLYAPATDVQAVFDRLSAAARSLPAADPRNVDQQRADLLIDAALHSLNPDQLPTAQGRRPHLLIHIAADTLLGDADQPGWVDGIGPVPAIAARAAATADDATWQWLEVDPATGEPSGRATRRYRPSQALVDHIVARDRHCVAPGCRQPASRADLDHIQPYNPADHSTQTHPGNLAALCRRHHQGKTHGPFNYRRNPDGSHTWNLGSRHTYTTRPPRTIYTRTATHPSDPTDDDPPPF